MTPEWQAWLDQLRALPHGEVGAALGQVLMLSEVLAKALPPPLAEDFRREVPAAVRARLERFQLVVQRPHMVERWVEPELLPLLDLLGRWLTRAWEAQADEARSLLEDLVFDTLDSACAAQGWFGLQRIELGRTRFDPSLHVAVEQRAGPEGAVVALLTMGRTDPAEGWPVAKAQVAVGAG